MTAAIAMAKAKEIRNLLLPGLYELPGNVECDVSCQVPYLGPEAPPSEPRNVQLLLRGVGADRVLLNEAELKSDDAVGLAKSRFRKAVKEAQMHNAIAKVRP